MGGQKGGHLFPIESELPLVHHAQATPAPQDCPGRRRFAAAGGNDGETVGHCGLRQLGEDGMEGVVGGEVVEIVQGQDRGGAQLTCQGLDEGRGEDRRGRMVVGGEGGQGGGIGMAMGPGRGGQLQEQITGGQPPGGDGDPQQGSLARPGPLLHQGGLAITTSGCQPEGGLCDHLIAQRLQPLPPQPYRPALAHNRDARSLRVG